MRVEVIKAPGGTLIPACDSEAERMRRFANGGQYTIELKATRNPRFHRKMFAFFQFCFQHWCADQAGMEFADESTQFDTFRRHLTVLAGFREVSYTIDGRVRVEARSLSYGAMDDEEFERCYKAMIGAAIAHIFKGCDSEAIWNRLMEFF
ncbi:DUF1367 family protein [Oceanisphaera sp. KMM 10153]|uniref:DUF1367 family protein n=1 Tax=Oceanisphaera submarina TaxID=3390193 RepID=UPI003976C392